MFDIVTIKDVKSNQGFELPEGSVLKEVKELKRSYKGLWCSSFGSFIVTVPKNMCKPFKGSKIDEILTKYFSEKNEK